MSAPFFKKNSYIFWVQTDEGVLLQNVQTNHFIELDKVQEKVWAYLDGTFSEDNIITLLADEHLALPKERVHAIVKDTVKVLLELDFINKN